MQLQWFFCYTLIVLLCHFAGVKFVGLADDIQIDGIYQVIQTINPELFEEMEKEPLVTVDDSKLAGGTMYYAVTTDNTAPADDNLYTPSIPTRTDVGTYYVWYKAKGDQNHSDSKATCVTVTIAAKPTPTPS